MSEPLLKEGLFLESQLLMGEKLRASYASGGFMLAEAIEQPKFYPSSLSWRGYLGWVKREDLVDTSYTPNAVINRLDLEVPFGSRVYLTDEGIAHLPCGKNIFIRPSDVIPLRETKKLTDEGRERILSWGQKFLGSPYVWGGRSLKLNGQSCCDCSGLVNLLYRQEGLSIPRDAHDQFLISNSLSYSELKPADLIFLSSGGRVHHVMLFVEGDLFLEAAGGQIRQVVISSSEKRLGARLEEIKNGDKVGPYRVFFRRV